MVWRQASVNLGVPIEAKLLRMQRSAQEAFKNLTEVIGIVNLQGVVELSTDNSPRQFRVETKRIY